MHELMGWPGPMRHRQYLAWMMWLAEQWNVPDRTDHYLMQVGAEVRRTRYKDPSRVKHEHLKLKFGDHSQDNKPSPAEQKQAIEASKAHWLSVVQQPRVGPGIRKNMKEPSRLPVKVLRQSETDVENSEQEPVSGN